MPPEDKSVKRYDELTYALMQNHKKQTAEQFDSIASKYDELVKLQSEQAKLYSERYADLLKAQERNTESIQALVEETRGIVELHRDLQGAARVGSAIQSFGSWLLKWGSVGVVFYAGLKWVVDHWDKFVK